MRPKVEICVTDIESALAAERGGADRVELCQDLASDGLTPGPGTIALTCRRVGLPVHVMARTRGGDFVPTAVEMEALRLDLAAAKELGASAIVLGILNPDRTIDRERTAELAARAFPLPLTFHRAFDLVPDPAEALETLIELGIARVLTSGGPGRAMENLARLAALQAQAVGRIALIAGGGIHAGNAAEIVERTGLREIHLASGAWGETPGRTEAGKVREIVRAIGGL